MNTSDRLGAALTDLEKKVLRAGGIDLEATLSSDPLLETRRKYDRLVAESLTPAEVARCIGVTEGEVLSRIALRLLYSLDTDSGPKLPMFQFHAGKPLPTFEELGPVIRHDIHPLVVFEWFTEPDIELYINEDIDQTVSPRDWLLMGEDPSVVSRLLRRL